jgi:hypothetical protein
MAVEPDEFADETEVPEVGDLLAVALGSVITVVCELIDVVVPVEGDKPTRTTKAAKLNPGRQGPGPLSVKDGVIGRQLVDS